MSEPHNAGDEWTSVNLSKSSAAPDPVPPVGPPPGYVAPTPDYSAAPPPVYGSPPPVYGTQAPGYGAPAYQPTGYPGATADPYNAAYGYPAYPVQSSQSDPLAIAALIFGILGFVCCLPGPVGLILGIISWRKSNADPLSGGSNRGMAIAGTILGGISTAIIVVYLVFVVVVGIAGSA
ncbi:MAG TPA: DUF4190 domain-containing protein [Gordonia sp. (in: high G+C Gram-positive bacteria)]|uniref:DUF4190 domain-containing protein n=1 Tax=unclassified Gordonia (in: high G+C Gram-positive bacteria) TaxID=2657482 RepID=UPI000FC34227|nr:MULTISPECIES: DUF4190 domain-containing protein [unclassified Gordonia (in: high G+C Gram-positive bacteria)]RTL08393.1 MAG: DUF4190 domain-containing protein [Acidimicrobiia bacterium]HNP58148.1 DUF4190 domain-containing protein [Gordonia sp. (in: high G+C Gram-positive bacteria)]HRC51063.1 DUF4190 domain-containing protein [Gordonia sp. (in: high G+C Gram-positive bacteria)]